MPVPETYQRGTVAGDTFFGRVILLGNLEYIAEDLQKRVYERLRKFSYRNLFMKGLTPEHKYYVLGVKHALKEFTEDLKTELSEEEARTAGFHFGGNYREDYRLTFTAGESHPAVAKFSASQT